MSSSEAPDLATILQEVDTSIEVHSSGSWRDRSAPHLGPQPTTTLAEILYRRFFQRRGVAEADPERPHDAGLRRRHTATLERAPPATALGSERWEILSVDGDEIVVERDGLHFRCTADELPSALDPDSHQAPYLALPTLLTCARPGFLRVVGSAGDVMDDATGGNSKAPWAGPGTDEPIVHLTWNLRPEGVADWCAATCRMLEASLLPFRLEMPADPLGHFGAADVSVSLTGADALEIIDSRRYVLAGLDRWRQIQEAVGEHLRPESPLGLVRLGPGIGLAVGPQSPADLGRRWSLALADILASKAPPSSLPGLVPPGRCTASFSSLPKPERSHLAQHATFTTILRRHHDQTPGFKGTLLVGRDRPKATWRRRGTAAAGSLPAGLDFGAAGLALVASHVSPGPEPTAGAADPSIRPTPSDFDVLILEIWYLASVLIRPRPDAAVHPLRLQGLNHQKRAPHDLLDVEGGALGILWAWKRSLARRADFRDVFDSDWYPHFEQLLRVAEPYHRADARSAAALLDLAHLTDRDGRGDLSTAATTLALELGERLVDEAEDRLFAHGWTAREAAEHALLFYRLWTLRPRPGILDAARRTLAYRPRASAALADDPAWRLLARLRSRIVDPMPDTGDATWADTLDALLRRLRAPASAFDGDLSLATGACLTIDAAIEASRVLAEDEKGISAELAGAAEDLMDRLLARHGAPSRWPILQPVGAPHPSLFHGVAGVAWTLHRLEGLTRRSDEPTEKPPCLLLPDWSLPLGSKRPVAPPDVRNRVEDAGPRVERGEDHTLLDLPLVGQERSFWCWAATEQMIRGFHASSKRCGPATVTDPALDQERIVSDRFGGSLVNRGQWPRFQGLTKRKVRRPLPWQNLRTHIDQQRPFAFALKNPGPAGSHMLAAAGYADLSRESRLDPGSAVPRRWILVHDPWPPRSGDTFLMPFRHYCRGTNGHTATVLVDPPGALPIRQPTEPSLPPAHGGFSESWQAAQVAAELLRIAAQSLSSRGPHRRRLLLAEPADPHAIEVRPRPIRYYVADPRELRQRGSRIFQAPAEEEIFPIVDAEDRLLSSVTVALRPGEGWEIRSVGRRHLAAALFALERQGFDVEDALPAYLPWGRKKYVAPNPSPDFVLFIPGLYELFLGVHVDWPRRGRVLIPVYGSERLGFAPGEGLAAETVFDALARLFRKR